MRPISLPEVPYGATAVRPSWKELPQAVREGISARLGGPIVAAQSAGGGFTGSFASVVTTAGGERAFVKAAPGHDPNADLYAREAALTSALPSGVRAARPRWSGPVGSYFVLILEAVDGHVPRVPWSRTELDAAVSAWSAAAEALATPPPGVRVPSLAEIVRAEMSRWSEVAAHRAPLPHPMPPARIAELADLEQGLPELVAGPGMLHGDLRVDNILIDGTGEAWLCDWTWPCLGAPWFDSVTLLVSAYAGGLEVDRYVADAPADGVDGALAALSGYWLTNAAEPPGSASPHHRRHQRFSGEAALAWLAARRGWS